MIYLICIVEINFSHFNKTEWNMNFKAFTVWFMRTKMQRKPGVAIFLIE